MPKPALKICGITRQGDVDLCLDLGIEFVGFNFCGTSKRRVEARQAAEMWRHSLSERPMSAVSPKAVAVICNSTAADIRQLLGLFPEISIIQCHGDETAGERRNLRQAIGERALWQAYRIGSHADVLAALTQKESFDMVLFDAAAATSTELGGTGQSFDWRWLSEITVPFVLAGGVRMQNIDRALSLKPVIIDICSGVEDAPGEKNHSLIQEIVDKLND